ncbi:MAG TPA: phytoene/squalene synthase family protein [Bacteroidia bacterium]|nr:phytoene/squalene synthase family protein [Bacteroidia bacterium]
MDPSPESAREIVRRSGSNLAFALAVLPGAARRDMEVFYAFCRVVDDLVDEPGLADDERRSGLRRWRDLVEGRATDPQPGIEQEFSEMQRRRDLSTADLLAILDGMEMDLEPQLFATKEDLRHYCYHVAGAVGLVSAALFGATDPEARAYAVELGYALQWTNILRDVGQDAREGRVFLPTEDIGHFGLTAEDLLSGSPDPEKFGTRPPSPAPATARPRPCSALCRRPTSPPSVPPR